MGKGNQADWYRHAGNVADTIVVTVSAAIGETLDGVTSVSATLRDRIDGSEVSLIAAASDSAAREVTVQLGTWLQNTAVAGDYLYVSLQITTTGGSVVTFPESLHTRPTLSIV